MSPIREYSLDNIFINGSFRHADLAKIITKRLHLQFWLFSA